MILTTIAYLKKDGKTLLLHRIKKKKDINEGKWIGVGGKLEPGESPDECVKREILEETGYTVHSIQCHGMLHSQVFIMVKMKVCLFILVMTLKGH